jgi:hypothetical protein
MQTITLEVKDNYLDNTLEILHGLKDVMIDKISVKYSTIVDANEKSSFIQLSNSTLDKVWDNNKDAEYDKYHD